MSKCEKYWVFGMILMLCVKHEDVPTLWGSISNVMCYVVSFGFFIAMVWCAIRGEK